MTVKSNTLLVTTQFSRLILAIGSLTQLRKPNRIHCGLLSRSDSIDGPSHPLVNYTVAQKHLNTEATNHKDRRGSEYKQDCDSGQLLSASA